MKSFFATLLLPFVLSNPIDHLNGPGSDRTTATVDVPLVTFDGEESTTFTFHALNDPVMGGISTGSWELDEVQEFGILNGTVKDVPALSAPGFLSAYAKGHFNDASMAISGDLVLKVRTSTPSYKGFRVSFAAGTLSPLYACSNGGVAPLSNGCFKTRFQVPDEFEDFVEIRLPFDSFSDHWNPATGDPTVRCVDDPSVCPTAKDLSQIKWIEVWAEGVGGDIHLEIESITASARTSSIEFKTTSPYIPLVTFNGDPSTSHEFTQLNDPVMGGVSVGTWSVNEENAYGIMNGTVKDVPFLHAPGFIKAASYSRTGAFNDASDAILGDLILNVRSTTPEYNGFRISVAAGTLSPEYSCASGGSNPLSGGCFKAKYSVPIGKQFSEVRIPFNTFSDHWSPATGEQTITCAEDPKVCPTANDLKDIKSIEIWAEGVKGDVHLEIQSIAAGVNNDV